MAKILITARSVAASTEGRAVLEKAGHEIVPQIGDKAQSEDAMLHAIRGMDAAIIGLDAMTAKVVVAGSPTLKIIARNGVGYSNVDLKAAADRGIYVTITPGANSISVCELVLGLMLSLARHIPAQDSEVHRGGWGRMLGVELYRKMLGVIGTGHIGGEVIKRAHAFGMDIVAFDVKPRPELTEQYSCKYVALDELFRMADFLTLHTPSTPQTKGLVQDRTLGLMRKTAFIINTARGDLVDEADLSAALKSGTIAGYGADAFVHEPPGADHPLLSLPNVVVTPHCGAYTKEAVTRSSVIAAEEVVRVLAGQQPLYRITS